jgi:DNA polymerase-3 subunit alpha
MVVHNCYQEDVMKFLSDVAMYTTEEADQIRSAISKKKHDVIVSAFDRIKKATALRGWDPSQSNEICEQIEAFSSYGFNKSHACFPHSQKIITEQGTATIGEIYNDPEKHKIKTINLKDSNNIEYFKPKKIWSSGIKQVYDIILNDGSLIRATEDHMVYTTKGWKTIREAFEQELEFEDFK